MMHEPGIRVGAISHNDKNTLFLFGYGIYEGDQPHPTFGISNPKITLDSGTVVWGCECWWAPEDQVKEQAAGYTTVVILDIAEERERAKGGA